MPDAIITPTPERTQHDNVVVRQAGRKSRTQIYVQPFWHTDRWKKILDERQRQAADMFVQDQEQLQRGTKSSLGNLDRVDNAGCGVVMAELASQAQSRIDAVRASLGPTGYNLIYCILIYSERHQDITGKHKQVSQGMVVMALEAVAVAYGLRA